MRVQDGGSDLEVHTLRHSWMTLGQSLHFSKCQSFISTIWIQMSTCVPELEVFSGTACLEGRHWCSLESQRSAGTRGLVLIKNLSRVQSMSVATIVPSDSDHSSPSLVAHLWVHCSLPALCSGHLRGPSHQWCGIVLFHSANPIVTSDIAAFLSGGLTESWRQ